MARIPRAEVTQQLDRIALILSEHPQGLSPAEVATLYAQRHPGLPIRTLGRRLEQLEAEGRARAEGNTRSRLYWSLAPEGTSEAAQTSARAPHVAGRPAARPPRPTLVHAVPEKDVPEPGYVPLSREGAEVWALIRRPMVEREPVGYDREFLEAYTPGETWYLPPELRARLHELGRGPDPDRPAGTYARDIMGRLLIDLAWASSRLEGNTYTRLDTQNLIEFGQRAEGTDAAEAQMILNHKTAIEYLVASAETVGFDRHTLMALHGMLSDNLLPNTRDEGALRITAVGITGTAYTPPGERYMIEEYFDLFLEKAAAVPDPFEQAFFAMVHIPYLQPFADVNKRTSRLAANISLIRGNLCPLSFVDVPERAYIDGTLAVYELRRVELLREVFEWAYARSCAQYRVVRDSLAQPNPIRLRYRNELTEVIRETVRFTHAPQKERLRQWAKQHVAGADVEEFVVQALEILVNLNEGSASRYHLRPSEFQAWRENVLAAEAQ